MYRQPHKRRPGRRRTPPEWPRRGSRRWRSGPCSARRRALRWRSCSDAWSSPFGGWKKLTNFHFSKILLPSPGNASIPSPTSGGGRSRPWDGKCFWHTFGPIKRFFNCEWLVPGGLLHKLFKVDWDGTRTWVNSLARRLHITFSQLVFVPVFANLAFSLTFSVFSIFLQQKSDF